MPILLLIKEFMVIKDVSKDTDVGVSRTKLTFHNFLNYYLEGFHYGYLFSKCLFLKLLLGFVIIFNPKLGVLLLEQ